LQEGCDIGIVVLKALQKIQITSQYCVTHKKLLLAYQTYAASQFFVRALYANNQPQDPRSLAARGDTWKYYQDFEFLEEPISLLFVPAPGENNERKQ